MIKEAIGKVVDACNLTEKEMVAVMHEIMSGEATDAQIAAFITALRLKGETVDEITGAAKVMREKATFIDSGIGADEVLVDTCGTGGDTSGTFNVSTTAAFVVAGAGLPVAKHGNRSVSSHCGSADVLESLGVNLSLPPEKVGECIRKTGICFMFAPMLHPAMKHAIGPRREMGIRTIFNVLGPLTNPAGATVQLMGVYDVRLTETIAAVLGRLGSKRALVVCGQGNMDELTVTGTTTISDYNSGSVTTCTITPEEVGLPRADISDIQGAPTAEESAAQVRAILQGEKGARRDMACLNGGAAIMAAGKAGSLRDGIAFAAESIDSGAALAKLEALVSFQ